MATTTQRRLLPGHILTDRPQDYASDLAEAAGQGWTLTAGKDVPPGVRYLLSGPAGSQWQAMVWHAKETGACEGVTIAGKTAVASDRRAPQRLAVVVSVHSPYLQYLPDALASCAGPWHERWLSCDGCDRTEAGWQTVAGDWRSPGPGRSRVIANTRAEWLVCLDADDALAPGYLDAMAKAAVSAPRHVGVLYPNFAWCDDRLEHPALRDLSAHAGHLPRENHIPTPSCWRVEALREIGGWPPGRPVMDDWRAALAITRRGWTVQNVPGAVVNVRRHGGNESRHLEARPETAWQAKRFAIVTLQAGRAECMEAWAEWLAGAQLPPACDLWVLDDCKDAMVSDLLAHYLSEIRAPGRLGSVAVRRANCPQPAVRDPVHVNHARVAWLYNAILPDALRCSDTCLLLEDDVVPPPDAFRMLSDAMLPNTRENLAAVSACYPPRNGPERVCLSSRSDYWHGMARRDVRPGVNRCGGVPGGCTLYDSAALLECLPMRFTYDAEGRPLGWDGGTSRALAAAGWQVAYHGDVWCEHRTGNK